MKLNWLLIWAVVTITVFASCGPDASYPIDGKPGVKIDEGLLGKWIAIEKKQDGFGLDSDIVYTVSRATEYTYAIRARAKRKNKISEDAMTGYLSKVGDARFLNVYIKDDPGGYLFIRILGIDAKTGKITATSLADTMLVTSAAAVRERITKNVDSPVFYSDTIEFVHVK